MTEKDIQDSIQVDYTRFNDHPYEGIIPEGLIEKFKIAIMASSPVMHNYKTDKLKEMIQKREVDLNVRDVGMIVNLIFQIPLDHLCDSIEEGLEYLSQLEQLRNEYNKNVEKFQKSMERKRTRLYELAGLSNSIKMPSIKN